MREDIKAASPLPQTRKASEQPLSGTAVIKYSFPLGLPKNSLETLYYAATFLKLPIL